MSKFIYVPKVFNRLGEFDTIVNADQIINIRVYDDEMIVYYSDGVDSSKFDNEALSIFSEAIGQSQHELKQDFDYAYDSLAALTGLLTDHDFSNPNLIDGLKEFKAKMDEYKAIKDTKNDIIK